MPPPRVAPGGGVIHGIASFPGVLSIERAEFVMSHGVSPGLITIVTHPQPNPPAMYGTFTIADGSGSISVPGCRVDDLRSETGGSGTTWTLYLVDRRWRWRDLGALAGSYNETDTHGKYIGKTIRSPTELAILCLERMGEVGYSVVLPPGLTSADGQGITGFLPNGTNFAASGTNPPVTWVATPPAQALQSLAEQYGCRVVYQVLTNSIYVGPLGVGGGLPPGSIASTSPALKSPELPDGVGVVGAPTRYQMRLSLMAVGQEWNGLLLPIDLLSYAPIVGNKVQISKGTVDYNDAVIGEVFTAFVGNNQPNNQGGELFTFTTVTGAETDAQIATALAAAINASVNPQVKGVVTATTVGGQLVITGLKIGVPFVTFFQVSDNAFLSTFNGSTTQLAEPFKGRSWAQCYPPMFQGVIATNRLQLYQARELAQRTVFKNYMLRGVDVNYTTTRLAAGGTLDLGGVVKVKPGPPIVPGYGPIQYLKQLVLEPDQVDQIVPEKPSKVFGVQAEGAPGPDIKDFTPFVVNFYQGYSKNKPHEVYGAVAYECTVGTGITSKNFTAGGNSLATDQVFVKSSVDPVLQQCIFEDYVYFRNGTLGIAEANLILQTAVMVKDPLTNQLLAYTQSQPLPSGINGTAVKWNVYPDVQLNVTSTYSATGKILTAVPLEADPFNRASYYLAGMAAQYFPSGALTNKYNNIMPIQLTGNITQVTFSIGPDGPTTIASINSEHQYSYPPYPARRRAELLPAIAEQILGFGRGNNAPKIVPQPIPPGNRIVNN